MDMAHVVESYGEALVKKYHHRLLPSHRRALNAMLACRKSCGDVQAHCQSCSVHSTFPLSCGHRSCPNCQNGDTTAWLNRQTNKLLPVPYFMVTFTLPRELRNTAWCHQKVVYSALFKAAIDTLKSFGLNPKQLGADIGCTGVLHTHTRRLDYHPHIHFIIPGGGIDHSGDKKQWRRVKGDYLFNGNALSEVFRGKMMYELIAQEIDLPVLPKKWVVHCDYSGKGLSALKYLSRYLYRGVISQKNILNDHEGIITFSYINSDTKKTEKRALKGEDFLWLVLQHVLPRRFRRIRDYGFLHPNAKKGLYLAQLVLAVKLPEPEPTTKPKIQCHCCNEPMILRVIPNKIPTHWIFAINASRLEGT